MISALNFKKYDKGALRGFFDLRHHRLTIKGCRLMSGSNGLWAALPQKEIEQDGERKWIDQLHLTPPEAAHVLDLVMADLKAQGHIENDKPKRQRGMSPDGEDLSDHYTGRVQDDIPF